ncbi:hypothetical protein [Chryseobacterium sp. SNU WT5]|uniref:hypothetical protein n=1 Tax=Chryseobacterium sp. SNU WT5 TaxID=2594269 RepID=UPI0016239B82|nr:hypothetical protein [Chryseobacterium sp. SNU WT5]
MVTEIKNVGGIWFICTDGHAKRLGHDKLSPEELSTLDEFIRDYKEYLTKINS